uniref:NADH-ubiquinone oxidoreductase chain 3 n=1 Tax=Glyptonotus cf. antarcticus FK-2009 TaxID=692432 RepID=E3SXA2_9CRUS|nr:NADH dehydrogenase subunit 3 [Glyptonotus cf. antarcticus FK-2009]
MLLLSSMSLILFLIALALVGVTILLGKKSEIDREKTSPFECGFDPLGSGRLSFSLRFFMISVIFLVFDVEITLLLPLVVGYAESELSIWAAMSALFLLILLAGTFHEWGEGSLDWKE